MAKLLGELERALCAKFSLRVPPGAASWRLPANAQGRGANELLEALSEHDERVVLHRFEGAAGLGKAALGGGRHAGGAAGAAGAAGGGGAAALWLELTSMEDVLLVRGTCVRVATERLRMGAAANLAL
jgi:hypothetical protein